MKLTDEQQHALELFLAGESLVLDAVAGSGKTTTLKLLARAAPERSGRYLAYNRAIADEAAASFPRHVRCCTMHSLAYKSVGAKLRHKLGGRLTGEQFAEALGISRGCAGLEPAQLGSALLRALRRFCQSDAPVPGASHVTRAGLDPEQHEEVRAWASGWLDGAWWLWSSAQNHLPISHEVYLKAWALTKPRQHSDVIFFDEAQDANPVTIGVVERWHQRGAQLVVVGDRYQQIYSWRGAVNAMERFGLERAALTRSWRYGEAIAALATEVLQRLRGAKLTIVGAPERASCLDDLEHPEAVLCRSNIGVIRETLDAMERGERPYIQGGIATLTALLQGAQALQRGQEPRCAELADFRSWPEVVKHSESEEGQDLRTLVRLVDQWGSEWLLDRIRQLEHVRPEEADLTISTAHKSKGLEWSSVRLSDDFPAPEIDLESGLPSSKRWSDEEAHLLYVAITRAQDRLDISRCPPLQEQQTLPDEIRSPGEEALSHPSPTPPLLTEVLLPLMVSPESRTMLTMWAYSRDLTPDQAIKALLHLAARVDDPHRTPPVQASLF